MAPLLAELAASRQRIEDLARENGRQAAELEALRAQHAALLASTAEQAPDPSPGAAAAYAEWGALVATLAERGLRVV